MVAYTVQESEALPYDRRRADDGQEHLQGVSVHNRPPQAGPTPQRHVKHVSCRQETKVEIFQHGGKHMHGREGRTYDAVRERGRMG